MSNPQLAGERLPSPARSIVLVHGAFVDASGWQNVYTDLTGRGYEVLVTQHPTQTLSGDVDVVMNAINVAANPAVLVGHSYGGAIITEAGNDPKVAALVYIAAFVPDAGESIADLTSEPLEEGESAPPIRPAAAGTLIVDPAGFQQFFAADVDADTTRFLASAQQPWGMEAVGAKIASPAWKAKPSAYLVASSDRMIPARAQRMMAGRAGARTMEVAASHAVMLSRPAEVADFIATAAMSL